MIRFPAMIAMGWLAFVIVSGPDTLTAAPAQTREWKTVRIGIDTANQPFSSIDPSLVPSGFDVSIARALCDRMKVKCDFVAATRAALVPDLLARKTDAVVASLAITEDSRKLIEFTDRYEALAARFVTGRTTAVTTVAPETMQGKTIGARVGSRYAAYLAEAFASKGVTIKLFNTDAEAEAELAGGRISAVLGGAVELYRWFEAGSGGRCCRFVAQEVRAPKTLGDGAGIGVRKEDGELRGMFNKALADILRDGTYEKINAGYFNFLIY
jgi:polar amino acid transport system substrate-binding protein